MSKSDELRHGAPGETAVHLCVDMQRMFAEATDWQMPWLERVLPNIVSKELLQELTDKFGGATSFVRAAGQVLWDSGGDVERDNIAVIEVMTLVRESLATASR
jgi:hypothetical protein